MCLSMFWNMQPCNLYRDIMRYLEINPPGYISKSTDIASSLQE